MNQKGEIIEAIALSSKPIGVTVVGSGLAAGPAIVSNPQSQMAQAVLEVPFYESFWWLASVAVLGVTVLVLTIANGVYTLRRNRQWSGEERRGK